MASRARACACVVAVLVLACVAPVAVRGHGNHDDRGQSHIPPAGDTFDYKDHCQSSDPDCTLVPIHLVIGTKTTPRFSEDVAALPDAECNSNDAFAEQQPRVVDGSTTWRSGYSIDLLCQLLKHVAYSHSDDTQRVRITFEFVDLDNNTGLMLGVNDPSSGVHAGIAATTKSAEREKLVSFSHTFFTTNVLMLTWGDGGATSTWAMGWRLFVDTFGNPQLFYTLILMGLTVVVFGGAVWAAELRDEWTPEDALVRPGLRAIKVTDEEGKSAAAQGLRDSLWWAMLMVLRQGPASPTGKYSKVVRTMLALLSLYLMAVLTATTTVQLQNLEPSTAIESLSDLNGLVVGTVAESTSETFLEKQKADVDGNIGSACIERYTSREHMLQAFINSRIDAAARAEQPELFAGLDASGGRDTEAWRAANSVPCADAADAMAAVLYDAPALEDFIRIAKAQGHVEASNLVIVSPKAGDTPNPYTVENYGIVLPRDDAEHQAMIPLAPSLVSGSDATEESLLEAIDTALLRVMWQTPQHRTLIARYFTPEETITLDSATERLAGAGLMAIVTMVISVSIVGCCYLYERFLTYSAKKQNKVYPGDDDARMSSREERSTAAVSYASDDGPLGDDRREAKKGDAAAIDLSGAPSSSAGDDAPIARQVTHARFPTSAVRKKTRELQELQLDKHVYMGDSGVLWETLKLVKGLQLSVDRLERTLTPKVDDITRRVIELEVRIPGGPSRIDLRGGGPAPDGTAVSPAAARRVNGSGSGGGSARGVAATGAAAVRTPGVEPATAREAAAAPSPISAEV